MPTSPAPQGRKKSYDPAFIRRAINMVETRGEAVTTSAVITAMHDRFDVPKTINQEAVKREVLSYVEDRDTQYREKAIQQLPQAVREAVNAAVAGLGKDCTTALALQYATLKDDTSSQLAMMTDEKLDMQRKVRELNAVIEG